MPTFALVLWILCGSVAALLDKKASATMNWQSVGFVYDLTVALSIPVYWYLYRDKIRFAEFSSAGVGWAAAASLVGFVGWFAYFIALQQYEASRVNAIGLIDIGLTCALCAIFLQEPVTVPKVIGIVLMGIGALVIGQ